MCDENRVIVYDGVPPSLREEHEQGEAFMEENYGEASREPIQLGEAAQVIESLIGPGEPVDTFYQENSPENDITDRIPEPKEDWTIFNLFYTHIGYASLIVKRTYGEELLFHGEEKSEAQKLFDEVFTLPNIMMLPPLSADFFSSPPLSEIDKEDAYSREKYLRERQDSFDSMAKEKQNTIETYHVAAVFPWDKDLEILTIRGKNLTAADAALKGVVKLAGFEKEEDSGYTVEKDSTVKAPKGWKRFVVETRYGEPFQVAVAHASTRLA